MVLACAASKLTRKLPTYMGVPTKKNPFDLWVYQEMLWELKPDLVIEIGTAFGGSALYLAHLLDRLGAGTLVSIDLNHAQVMSSVRSHPRIRLVTGDAVDVVETIRPLAQAGKVVMVIEDSSHTYDNTLAVLRTYAGFVTRGSYFIVEDTINHHGLNEGPSPGPYEAVSDFLDECPRFVPDSSREKFLITSNPKGFLKRVE
jgi:cephalosporin hydroxylase